VTDLVSPVPALLEKLLAQPDVELVEHRVTHDEYAMVATGRARIRLQWHHQQSMSTITPDWSADVRHTTFAYAVACYVAGEVVDPLQGVAGEIDFMVGHLDVIRAICEDEDSWVEFSRTTDRMLGLPDLYS